MAQLHSPDARRTAYEMAASVAYADGLANAGEQAFLTELRRLLDQNLAYNYGDLTFKAMPLPNTTCPPKSTGDTALADLGASTTPAGIRGGAPAIGS